MIVRILDSALEDLDRGRNFYERPGEGLGVYFLDSLLSEIDSLVLFGGIHRKSSDIIVCWPNAFHTRFITRSRESG
jgi:hypothetical protein